jgi:DNA-binding GntR family transcriptional regulator
MIRAAKGSDHAVNANLNWQFHRNINRLSGSRKLITALRSVALDLPRDYLTHIPGWIAKSNREHGAFLAAMRGRRHDEAARLMTDHVTDSGHGLIKYLESAGLELK